MNLTFTNGTDAQREVVHSAVRKLLNLDLDTWNFSWTVTFVADPGLAGHTEYATTSASPGVIDTEIRQDFPGFQPTEGTAIQFSEESVIHELGHGLFGQLSEEDQQTIMDWFTADGAEWYDPDNDPWEDRGIEGYAETFKDAFLPQRFRAYSNRTNVHIPISDYPEFRALFRHPTGAIGGGAGQEYRTQDEYEPPPGVDLTFPIYEGGDFIYFTDNPLRQPDGAVESYEGFGVYVSESTSAGQGYRLAATTGIATAPPGFLIIEGYTFAPGGGITISTGQLELHPVGGATGVTPDPPAGEVAETDRESGTRRNDQPISGSVQ